MRHRITLIAAALTLLLQGLPARAQFAVIDAQNSANQIMSYIQDGENALRSIESIAQVFESIERVHGALDSLQSIYSRVSPVIRDTKAVADIAVNYARVVDDWERYSDYMKSLDGASYNEIKYSFYWGTRACQERRRGLRVRTQAHLLAGAEHGRLPAVQPAPAAGRTAFEHTQGVQRHARAQAQDSGADPRRQGCHPGPEEHNELTPW